jgi:general secretion pathway protein J
MKGFTLIEMLVALAALSILAAGGFAVAGVSVSSHDVIRERQAETQALLRLRSALRGDLTQAATRRARDINGVKEQAALTGGSGGNGIFLSLVRRGWDNPSQQGRASLQQVDYRLREGNVERVWRRHVDGSPAQDPQVLMTGVESVSLEFYDWNQWTSNWRGAPNRPLPRAIRVTMTLSGSGEISQAFLLPGGAR